MGAATLDGCSARDLQLDAQPVVSQQDWAVEILRHLEMWAELTPDYSLVSRTGEQNARRRRGLFQLAALRLTPLRNATVLSLVLAAFSSFRLVLRKRTISSWPSSSAHAISVP